MLGEGWGYVQPKAKLDEKFTVAYHKNQNDRYRTFYPEKKGTQKRITREQAPLLLTPSSEKNKRITGRGNLPLRPSEI